ncbi:MAG: TonB-dependent receptor [Brevundimonas sp.]|uniref:TonB-dependent receptor n=1 Tax=Brevundimonas sp. TaxID=1871086 RepID=UPI001A2AD979|nr:TonB-dependent receptor [Brevundimonas sp.]MBJ7448580.1 TonB-dependent receptor [Brevundimonas sp.]
MLRTLLLASSAALVWASQVQAQDAEVTQIDDVIVTGSQVTLTSPYPGGQVARGGRVGLFGNLGVMDTPFATTSYTEELTRNQQARSVGDVLQNDPAVRVSKGFGNFQELYVIRGFPVYSDDMTYNGLYGILPRQFVAAEFLERVEVFHGATAFLNGAAPGGSGVGGAFNLTPKRAPDEALTRLTAGIDGESELYLAADIARRFGAADDYGLRLNVARRDGEAGIEGESRELTAVGLGLDRRGERARFSADIGYQDHRIDAPRPTVTPLGAVPAPPSADSNFAQPWTYTDERQLFGVVRGEFDLSDTVTAWAAFGGRQGEEANVLANPTAQPDGTLSAYRFDNTREDTVWSGDIGVRAEVTTGPVGHTLVASASQVQSSSRNAYAFSDFAGFASDLYNPVVVMPPVPDALIGGDLDNPLVTERVHNSSIAIADMMSFMDGKLLATVGARYQQIETRTSDYNTGAPAPTPVEGDAITPVFALVYKLSDAVAVYANYAEALQPGKIAPSAINGRRVQNQGEVLSPFRSEQSEIGVKYDGGTFGGSLSLFQTTQATESFDIVNPDAPLAEQFGTYGDGDEQQNRGVEVSVFGEPVSGLRLIGGASWLDTEIVSTEAIGVPDFQANANVEWDVPQFAGLTLEGRAVFTGEQQVNEANTVQLDSWTRFDAGLRYVTQVADRPVTLRARVENLADEDQWVAVGGFPGANYLTLGAPRTLRLSLSTDF